MSEFRTTGGNTTSDKIEPSRATSGLARWRKAVAQSSGEDPGAPLDQPDRRLVMLRIFGSTRRMAELCHAHPAIAARALIEGPSPVLAEAARDLSGLDRGVGGPDALHAAMSPIKDRADLAISIAELSGKWSVPEATAARVDLAERLTETALSWLVRSAVKRGELTVSDPENIMHGVFVVAGGDFAHEDLSPYGPLDVVVAYEEAAFPGNAGRGADRIFLRIGAELREAFEGKPGDHTLFALRTPLGSGVGGAGFSDSAARIAATANGPQAGNLKRWLATARVVAGDRTTGGQFLENNEETIWNDTPLLTDSLRETFEKPSEDPRTPFRNIANLCRFAVGAGRPVFRISSARDIFETAARSGAITQDAARRLIAGEELAHIAVSRLQMMKGAVAYAAERDDEKSALALLCGFSDFPALEQALNGVVVDAKNTLRLMMRGPQHEVSVYNSADNGESEDADKLEDLGFTNGDSLSASVDRWASRTGHEASGERFSAVAPGLLTDFGETQNPNLAVRLFDNLMQAASGDDDIYKLISDGNDRRNALVDALGCFGAVVSPLTVDPVGVRCFIDHEAGDAPQSSDEWLSRFPPPPIDEKFSIEAYGNWRRQVIGTIAMRAVSGDISFDIAADALGAVHQRTLGDVFDAARSVNPPKDEEQAGDKIALHVFDGQGAYLPGVATCIGFMADKSLGEPGEKFTRRYLSMLENLGDGMFAVLPDTSHRPGGVTGALVPDTTSFKSYVQSEAVAYDQILFARGRVIAGDEKACAAAADALRAYVSSNRRADILVRDLDRARSQRMRRERPSCDWDIDRLDGGRQDVELIIGTLIFKHAPTHAFIQDADPMGALDGMARAGLISDETANTLKSARAFWIRLLLARTFAQWNDPVRTPVRKRFGRILANAAGVQKFEQVRPLMRGYAEDVTRQYSQVVLGRPPLSVVAQAAG